MDGEYFEAAVHVVNDRLARSSSVYQRSGVAVRDQLVGPILTAVGWHTYDTREVQPCETSDEGPYYYVLLQNGDPAVLVQAVDTETRIESPVSTSHLAALSRRVGAVRGLLTNGRTWVLVRPPKEGAGLPDPIEWQAQIDDEPVESFQSKLAVVSKEGVLRLAAS